MSSPATATATGESAGGRYGLGLGWRPLSCGGGVWTHGGDVPGFSTVGAVSDNGATSAVVSVNITAEPPVRQAAWDLVDHALCTGV